MNYFMAIHLNNLDETGKHNLSTHTKWTHKEKQNLNTLISIEGIEFIIKNNLQQSALLINSKEHSREK